VDDIRNRYLRDRVLTATPAQRVVLLYDRLALDLRRAQTAEQRADAGEHLGHAARIVGELLGSLDHTAGGPAANLASVYLYLLRELLAAQTGGDLNRVNAVEEIVLALRDTWTQVAEGIAGGDTGTPGRPLVGAAWIA
jgi:flagellar protein FliS